MRALEVSGRAVLECRPLAVCSIKRPLGVWLLTRLCDGNCYADLRYAAPCSAGLFLDDCHQCPLFGSEAAWEHSGYCPFVIRWLPKAQINLRRRNVMHVCIALGALM
jgi:hypothetical protein